MAYLQLVYTALAMRVMVHNTRAISHYWLARSIYIRLWRLSILSCTQHFWKISGLRMALVQFHSEYPDLYHKWLLSHYRSKVLELTRCFYNTFYTDILWYRYAVFLYILIPVNFYQLYWTEGLVRLIKTNKQRLYIKMLSKRTKIQQNVTEIINENIYNMLQQRMKHIK